MVFCLSEGRLCLPGGRELMKEPRKVIVISQLFSFNYTEGQWYSLVGLAASAPGSTDSLLLYLLSGISAPWDDYAQGRVFCTTCATASSACALRNRKHRKESEHVPNI